MTKRIIVKLGPNGQILVEAEGFVGPSCAKATKFLEQIYGATINFTAKDEYFLEATVEDGHRVSGYCG